MNLPSVRALPTTIARAALFPIDVARNIGHLALVSPDSAREHPCSRQLQALLDKGYVPSAPRIRHEPTRVEVSLRLRDSVEVVASDDPAFAVYVARRLPRARAAVHHDQARRLVGLPARS